MPFKANAACRHHIPKQKRRGTNWAAYEASLHQRGSLTIWFSDEAIAGWRTEPRTTRGGQAWYSPLAILTALTLRAVFRLAWRSPCCREAACPRLTTALRPRRSPPPGWPA